MPGVNRYNPNYEALKPRSIGVIIRPLRQFPKGSKLRSVDKKNLIKQLHSRLKNRPMLRVKKVLATDFIFSITGTRAKRYPAPRR